MRILILTMLPQVAKCITFAFRNKKNVRHKKAIKPTEKAP